MEKQKEMSALTDGIKSCGEVLLQAAGKLSDIAGIINDLGECGRTLVSLAGSVKDCLADTPKPQKEAPADTEQDKKYAKEDVRRVLAEASQNGHRDGVIALLKKYGADNITSLDTKDYAAVIAEAEGWKNA